MDVAQSNERKIGFACIRFKDRGNSDEYDIVPLSFVKERFKTSLKPFQPTCENDFDKDQLYHVYWKCLGNCSEDHDHEAYFKAHILHLGESESDVKHKITSKRLRFPNRKYCATSSSTDIEYESKLSLPDSKIVRRKLKESVAKRKEEKADHELQKYYRKQAEVRRPVVDSDTDYDEPAPTQPGVDTGKRKLAEDRTARRQEPPNTPSPRIVQREKDAVNHDIDELQTEPIDDCLQPNTVPRTCQNETSASRQNKATTLTAKLPRHQNETLTSRLNKTSTSRQSEASNSRQEVSTSRQTSDKNHVRANHLDELQTEPIDDCLQPDTVPRTCQNKTSASRKNKATTLPDTLRSHRNETRTLPQTSDDNHVRADHLAYLTNVRTPERLNKRLARTRYTSTECHGLRRFNIVNGKIYLGLDVFVGKECWANTMTQKPTTFIRDVAVLIWEEKGILNRCFRTDKVSVIFEGRSPRKEFEADKLQLLRDLLKYYLEHHRYNEKDKRRIERNMNLTLSRFVQDIRKPYKHLVRKLCL